MKEDVGSLPKFICIGAQRAGTTWLHECLNEHPQVFVPEIKEIHFFDRFYDTGIEAYRCNFPKAKLEEVSTWGEITPNYYQEPGALERIHHHIPSAKIIYIVREPVSRAYSQYQLYAQSDYSGLSFEEVIREKSSVLDLSMQGKHLDRLLKLFPKEQVLVLLYDELNANPSNLLRKVFKFLDVKDDFLPTFMNKRVNRVVLPKTQNLLKKIGLSWLIEWVKKSPFAEVIKNAFYDNKQANIAQTPQMSELKPKFENDIARLESVLQVDLGHWRK